MLTLLKELFKGGFFGGILRFQPFVFGFCVNPFGFLGTIGNIYLHLDGLDGMLM